MIQLFKRNKRFNDKNEEITLEGNLQKYALNICIFIIKIIWYIDTVLTLLNNFINTVIILECSTHY